MDGLALEVWLAAGDGVLEPEFEDGSVVALELVVGACPGVPEHAPRANASAVLAINSLALVLTRAPSRLQRHCHKPSRMSWCSPIRHWGQQAIHHSPELGPILRHRVVRPPVPIDTSRSRPRLTSRRDPYWHRRIKPPQKSPKLSANRRPLNSSRSQVRPGATHDARRTKASTSARWTRISRSPTR